MARIRDYLKTALDLKQSTNPFSKQESDVTIGDAWTAAKSNPKGIVKGASDERSSSAQYNNDPYNTRQGFSSDPNRTPGQPSSVSGESVVNSGGSRDRDRTIEDAEDDQKEAAEKAEEEARKAAGRRYEAQADAAGDAKVSAKGNYDWIIDTLGSNKQDLLDTVATNTAQGVQNYGVQSKETGEKYDSAKQEILSTYRDLQTRQEKIMRGSGMGQSSRSMEAQLKLNNLMAKDLGGVSKNQADSLALIGTALTNLKQRALDTENSIGRETKSKLDKAALEYRDQVTAIDNNLQLSKNAKADAFAQAETQLARDTASITSWASGLKLEAEQTLASTKESLDGWMNENLEKDISLGEKTKTLEEITNSNLTQAGFTQLNQNSESINNRAGVFQGRSSKYKTAEEIQAALASGELNASQAEQAMASLSSGTNTGTDLFEAKKTEEDPLSAALFAR